MPKAVLYTRVSTEEQAKHGFSLEHQIKSLKNYCKSNDIIPLKHFEEDFSGKNFNRPKWQELRKFIKENKKDVEMVLFTRWDRFSRNMTEALTTIYEFKKINIELIAIE